MGISRAQPPRRSRGAVPIRVHTLVRGQEDEELVALLKAHNPEDYTLRYWEWYWRTSTEVLLATDRSGTAVATCRWCLQPDQSAWIASIRVHPSLRGRGIGRALTAQAMARAHERGIATARLLTESFNAAMNTMAGQVGMEVCSWVSVWLAEVRALSATSLHDPSRPLEGAREALRLLETSPLVQATAGLVCGWYVYHKPTVAWVESATKGGRLRIGASGAVWLEAETKRGTDRVLSVQPVVWSGGLPTEALQRAHAIGCVELHLLLPAGHKRDLTLLGAGFSLSPWASLAAIYQGRTSHADVVG